MALNQKIRVVFGILLLTLTTGTVFAQKKFTAKETSSGPEILFLEKKWEAVAAEAKRKGKYIFVDAYTSWCGPCKLLRSTTFRDKNTAAYFNEKFINYAVDMEKREGAKLAERWDVTAYPALLFFSPDDKMVLRQVGYVDGKKLVELGKQALGKK